MANLPNSLIALVSGRIRLCERCFDGLLKRSWLMIVFSWLPVIDETVVFACQIFNLERSYRLNGRKILVLILIVPFMYV